MLSYAILSVVVILPTAVILSVTKIYSLCSAYCGLYIVRINALLFRHPSDYYFDAPRYSSAASLAILGRFSEEHRLPQFVPLYNNPQTVHRECACRHFQ